MVGRGPFKRQSLKVLVERQIPISTIIDIGVLSGTPELKEAFPKTRHILFEPVSEFHKKIRENYTGLDYRLIEAAVTDEDRDVTLDVTLHVRKAVSQTGITHSSVVDDASENSEPRIVTSTRLDTFTKANALVKPYLVKMRRGRQRDENSFESHRDAERRERRYDRNAEGRIFRAHRQCQPSQPGHIGGLVSVR